MNQVVALLIPMRHCGKLQMYDFVKYCQGLPLISNNAHFQCQKLFSWLGKPLPTKTDEFLEKFQTAFDPPPSFSENYVADFLKSCTALNNQILPY